MAKSRIRLERTNKETGALQVDLYELDTDEQQGFILLTFVRRDDLVEEEYKELLGKMLVEVASSCSPQMLEMAMETIQDMFDEKMQERTVEEDLMGLGMELSSLEKMLGGKKNGNAKRF